MSWTAGAAQRATHHGRVVVFGGGVPLRVGERVVGAIGVSGGTPEQDHAVAEAGADELARAASLLPGRVA